MTFCGTLLLAAAGTLCPGSTLGSEPPARAVHSIAQINDPLSHGVLGDSLLSLNEAIQLYNRTITTSQLSLNEINQLGGSGADIAWAAIDASAVPVITVERDFDTLIDFPHGLLIEGYNGEAIIDFAANNVHNGFQSLSNFNNYRNLIIRGSDVAIDLSQTDASFGGCIVKNVVFENQAIAAFRFAGGSVGGFTRLFFEDCSVVNCPAGLDFDDTMSGRSTTLALFDTEFQGVTDGIVCKLGDLGTASLQFERLDIAATGIGLGVLRPAGATRQANVLASVVKSSGQRAFVLENATGASTNQQLRMLDVSSATGAALELGSLGTPLAGYLQDSTAAGSIFLRGGGTAPDFPVQNLRASNGTVTIASDASQTISLRLCRFDSCVIQVPGVSGTTPFVDNCIVGGSIAAPNGAQASLLGTFSSAAHGTGVTASGSVPNAQLGSMRRNAPAPVLGGVIDLQVDLPPGLLGIFALGPPSNPVFEFSATIRAYADLNRTATIPGLFRLQQGLQIPVPFNFALLQSEWVCQLIVLPDPGVQAPSIQTPPGTRFRIGL